MRLERLWGVQIIADSVIGQHKDSLKRSQTSLSSTFEVFGQNSSTVVLKALHLLCISRKRSIIAY